MCQFTSLLTEHFDYNTHQEQQQGIYDVRTRSTCYNWGAIEISILLERSVTKKKQWDREGESGCWPGYIDFTLVIFKIIPFLLLPSAIHRIIYVKPGTFLPLLLILIYYLISRQNSRT